MAHLLPFLGIFSLLLKDLNFFILILKIMAKYCYASTAAVQNDGGYSEPFPVTNMVKQGCVMAPTLFSMMFSARLTDTF